MTKIPDYKSASKNRRSGTCSRLEHFVTEWEPSATSYDQCEIDQWRSDLAKVLEEERASNEEQKLSPLFIVVMAALVVQIVVNLAFCVWRFSSTS